MVPEALETAIAALPPVGVVLATTPVTIPPVIVAEAKTGVLHVPQVTTTAGAVVYPRPPLVTEKLMLPPVHRVALTVAGVPVPTPSGSEIVSVGVPLQVDIHVGSAMVKSVPATQVPVTLVTS